MFVCNNIYGFVWHSEQSKLYEIQYISQIYENVTYIVCLYICYIFVCIYFDKLNLVCRLMLRKYHTLGRSLGSFFFCTFPFFCL